MKNMTTHIAQSITSRLILGVLLAAPLACGDEQQTAGKNIVFQVEQGTCQETCELVYEFFILFEENNGTDIDYCIHRTTTASNIEGIQEAMISEVNPEDHTSLAIAVRVTCKDALYCPKCITSKIIPYPPKDKYYLTLSRVDYCVPTDDILSGISLSNCSDN